MVVKSVEIDLSVKGDVASKAKIDAIDAKAEHLKKIFGDGFTAKINTAAASEKLKVFRAEMADATKDRTATVKVKVDDSALAKLAKSAKGAGGPAWLGPVLALTPAIGTLGGVAAGAGVALTGAFTAGAGALAAFGAVAKPVLTDAKTAAAAVQTAQYADAAAVAKVTAQYTYAMSVAKTKAQRQAAYAAEQKGFANAEIAQNAAVAKAYADLSPAQIALSKQLGAMSAGWDKVKAAQTPVVAGALQPWLKSVTDLTGKLAPIIAEVSPVISQLGTQFGALIGSPQFTAFRDFIAGTGSRAVGAIGGTLIDFVKAFITLLPQFDPLIEKAVGWIANLGPAVATWASSQNTADNITKFMVWFSNNGPAVGGFLTNVGGALKALAPGLTAGGSLELKVISGFLGLVAKLPPGIAKPLAEVAGAALILSKMGGGKVISFLVTGKLGGIFGGGGAAAGAAEAGGAASIWSKLTPGAKLVGGTLAITLLVDAVLKGTPSGPGGKNWFDNPFGMPGPKDKASAGNWLTSWSPYENFFTKTIPGWFSSSMAGAKLWGSTFASSVTGTFSSIAGGAKSWWGNVTGSVSGAWHTITGTSSSGGAAVAGAFGAAGAAADALRTKSLLPLTGAAARVSGGIQGLQGYLNTLHAGSPYKVSLTETGVGNFTITQGTSGHAGGTPTGGRPGAAAGLYVAAGTGPVADDVLIRASKGELVVPANMVNAGAVDHLRGKIPGFAAGGSIGSLAGETTGFHNRFAATMTSATETAMTAAMKAAITVAAAAAAKAISNAGAGAGGGAARWAGVVHTVLSSLGLPYGDAPTILSQINTESGGNPAIVNKWDSNWLAGHPSVGLMQVIAGTFARYAGPLRNTGPFEYGVSVNPTANVYAGTNYAINRYGNPGFLGVLGHGHGYASGGLVASQGAAYLKAWERKRHPLTVNAGIDWWNKALSRDAVLAGAHGLTHAQHKHYVQLAAMERKQLAGLARERTVLRDWRGELGGSDTVLGSWIHAAGSTPSLARSVRAWKRQRAFQLEEIGDISAMLGWSAAQRAAIAKTTAKAAGHVTVLPTAPTGVLATHTYGGDVADTIGAVLASALGPFTGAARGGLLMDKGGWLKPGWNPPMFNNTGRPEHLVPARGGGNITLQVAPGGGSDFERFMTAMIKKYVKVRGGGSVERAYGAI